jgi:hypothetical protein
MREPGTGEKPKSPRRRRLLQYAGAGAGILIAGREAVRAVVPKISTGYADFYLYYEDHALDSEVNPAVKHHYFFREGGPYFEPDFDPVTGRENYGLTAKDSNPAASHYTVRALVRYYDEDIARGRTPILPSDEIELYRTAKERQAQQLSTLYRQGTVYLRGDCDPYIADPGVLDRLVYKASDYLPSLFEDSQNRLGDSQASVADKFKQRLVNRPFGYRREVLFIRNLVWVHKLISFARERAERTKMNLNIGVNIGAHHNGVEELFDLGLPIVAGLLNSVSIEEWRAVIEMNKGADIVSSLMPFSPVEEGNGLEAKDWKQEPLIIDGKLREFLIKTGAGEGTIHPSLREAEPNQ